MDNLLVAVGVLWEEVLGPMLHNLRMQSAVASSGMLAAARAQHTDKVDYWEHRIERLQYEIGMLENVRDAMIEAQKA